MTLLVLGGSGFLGAHLVAALEDSAEPVVSASRRPGEPRAARTAVVDLARPGAAAALIERESPRGVFHLSALARVGDCERDLALARRLNRDAPAEVAAACAARGLRFLFVSTDLVFGGTPPRSEGYRECDAPAPRHAYGRSKAAGEAAVERAHADALVVRLPLLFGDSGGRGLGASDSLLAALDAGAEPTLFTDEWRSPLDVGVAARALIELFEGPATGLVHVGGPDRVTRYELGLLVLESAARADERERIRPGRRADLGLEGRPADVSLDSSVARASLRTRLPGLRDSLASIRPA
jgi:dTDP-4-dehydrorhamnose reductase